MPSQRSPTDVSDRVHVHSPTWPVSVGAPVWQCEAWADDVFPIGTPRDKWLWWYSRLFNVVEGNSTFYGVPSMATFQRWAKQAAEGFEFCMKVPRTISHDAMLANVRSELDVFTDRLRVLADHRVLGPTLLQLGPSFGFGHRDSLQRFLHDWPDELPLAVEVRHPDWFDRGEREACLADMLRSHSADYVIFDSRALFQAPPDDEIEVESQRKKPKTPLRETVTASRPMVRMVGRNDLGKAESYLQTWAKKVIAWKNEGLRPIFFTHSPDDAFAPAMARCMVGWLSKINDAPASFQTRSFDDVRIQSDGQMSLF